jgi:predicted nucleic acid-binding protein
MNTFSSSKLNFYFKIHDGKNLLRHEGTYVEIARMMARDLWTNDELRLHQIADSSCSQAQRDVELEGDYVYYLQFDVL